MKNAVFSSFRVKSKCTYLVVRGKEKIVFDTFCCFKTAGYCKQFHPFLDFPDSVHNIYLPTLALFRQRGILHELKCDRNFVNTHILQYSTGSRTTIWIIFSFHLSIRQLTG